MLSNFLISVAVVGLLVLSDVESYSLRAMSTFVTGAGGVRVIGTEDVAKSQTGHAVRAIGDYNKDGLQDFAVSSLSYSITGRLSCGLVVIILGQASTWVEVDVKTVTSGLTTRRIIGAIYGDNAGSSLAPAGDVNDDGYDDVLIGVGGANFGSRTDAGAVFVLFGMTSSGGYTDIDLASFTAGVSTGFAIYGPAVKDYLGNSVLSVLPFGDLNGDSINDFAISAPNSISSGKVQAGSVWFIYGTTATPVDLDLSTLGSAGIELNGAQVWDNFGVSIDNVGDFNGDGLNDTIIGAYNYSSNSIKNRGAAYLIYGTTSPISLDMTTFVTGAAGICFLGAEDGDRAGSSVGGAGDINGDGKMDLLIGAASAGCCGVVYVIFGTSTQFNADFLLSTLTAGPVGFTVSGVATGNSLGWSVSRGGDLDQDGVDDYLLGAFNGVGRVYVLYGSLTAPSANINLATYEGKIAGFSGTGSSLLGYSLSGGVDVTGDGFPDILMGARNADVTPVVGDQTVRADVGAAYLWTGPVYPWSAAPTRQPSQLPTAAPSDPSVAPTRAPTNVPSLNPTTEPTAAPTETPSVDPSANPSIEPSKNPSVAPSAEPSASPSTAPSADPSRNPSPAPSMDPSVTPSATPSAGPSAHPSFAPSENPSFTSTLPPSAEPTRTPTAPPTKNPTLAPSVSPSVITTRQPTALPTARPTDKPYQIVLAVQQDVYFVNKADYDSQKVQCNLTIQYTVAASMDGVVPERVTDIVVEEAESARVGNMRALNTIAPPVSLKYKVTVYDPVLSAEVLTAQLKAKVRSGDMDNAFRAFALQFNATKMQNGTFTEPQFTFENAQGNFSDPPTSGETAGLVLGGFIFLVLVSVGVYLLVKWLRSTSRETDL